MESNNEEIIEKKGILYLVSTPIGNWDDITLRAIKILKNCDKVICEEGKEAAKVLRQYNIHKEIELLNEQNEDEKTLELILELEKGNRFALISDCGTPVFADPGFALVKSAISRNIEIAVIPGASSLMAGIVRSGFPITEFLFAGFLNRNKEDRLSQFRELSKEKRTVALLETPYRLMPFLEAAKDIMPFRQAYIGCNLTMPFETHHYGTFTELYERFSTKKFKGEFIVVFEGLPSNRRVESDWDDERDKHRDSYSDKKFDRKPKRFDNRDNSKRRDDRRSRPDGDRRSRPDGDRRSRPDGDRRGRSDGERREWKSDDKRENRGRGRFGDKKFRSDDKKSFGDRKFKSDDKKKFGDRRSSSDNNRRKPNTQNRKKRDK